MASETFSRDVAEAIDRALDARRDYLLIAAAGVALSISLLWFFTVSYTASGDGASLAILPGLAGVIYASTQFRKTLTRAVMPVLCKEMFGWHFREFAHARDIEPLQNLGLLPTNGYPETLSDTVGRTSGRFIETWGVQFVRGVGKHRRVYPAYVCELPAKPEWHGLCLAPTSFGYPFRGRKNAVAVQPVVRRGFLSIGVDLTRRGAYDGSIDALAGMVDDTDRFFLDGAFLVGISFDEDRTRVVIRDKSQPLSLRGILLTRRQLIARVMDRIDELSVPLRMCDIWGLPRGDVSLSAADLAPQATSAAARSTG